jgi:hypothetical protein
MAVQNHRENSGSTGSGAAALIADRAALADRVQWRARAPARMRRLAYRDIQKIVDSKRSAGYAIRNAELVCFDIEPGPDPLSANRRAVVCDRTRSRLLHPARASLSRRAGAIVGIRGPRTACPVVRR